MTKKVVLKLGVGDEREKKRALQAVSSLPGIESLSMDMNAKKLTITGDVDAVEVVGKLKKCCRAAQLLTVAAAADEKKEEPRNTDAVKIEENHYTHHPQHDYYYTTSTEEDPNSCVIS